MQDCGIKITNPILYKLLGYSKPTIIESSVNDVKNLINTALESKWLEIKGSNPIKVKFNITKGVFEDATKLEYVLENAVLLDTYVPVKIEEEQKSTIKESTNNDLYQKKITVEESIIKAHESLSSEAPYVNVKLDFLSTSSKDVDENTELVIRTDQATHQRNIMRFLKDLEIENPVEFKRYSFISLMDRDEFFHDESSNYNEETKAPILILVKDFSNISKRLSIFEVLKYVPNEGLYNNLIFPISTEGTKTDTKFENTSFFNRNKGNAHINRINYLKELGYTIEEIAAIYDKQYKNFTEAKESIVNNNSYREVNIHNISSGILDKTYSSWQLILDSLDNNDEFDLTDSSVLTTGTIDVVFKDPLTKKSKSLPALPNKLNEKEYKYFIELIDTVIDSLKPSNEENTEIELNTLVSFMAFTFGSKRPESTKEGYFSIYNNEGIPTIKFKSDNTDINIAFNSSKELDIDNLAKNLSLLKTLFEKEGMNMYRNFGTNISINSKTGLSSNVSTTINNIIKDKLKIDLTKVRTNKILPFIADTLNLTPTSSIKSYVVKTSKAPYTPHKFKERNKVKYTFEPMSRYATISYGNVYNEESRQIEKVKDNLTEEYLNYIESEYSKADIKEVYVTEGSTDQYLTPVEENLLIDFNTPDDKGNLRMAQAFSNVIFVRNTIDQLSDAEQNMIYLEEKMHALVLSYFQSTSNDWTLKDNVTLSKNGYKNYPEIKSAVDILFKLKKLQESKDSRLKSDKWKDTLGEGKPTINNLLELLGRGTSDPNMIEDLKSIQLDNNKDKNLLNKLREIIVNIINKILPSLNNKLELNAYEALLAANTSIISKSNRIEKESKQEQENDSNIDWDIDPLSGYSFERFKKENVSGIKISLKQKNNILDYLFTTLLRQSKLISNEELQNYINNGFPKDFSILSNFNGALKSFKKHLSKSNKSSDKLKLNSLKSISEKDIINWINNSQKFKFGQISSITGLDSNEDTNIDENSSTNEEDAIQELIYQFEDRGNKKALVDRISSSTARLFSILPRMKDSSKGVRPQISNTTSYVEMAIVSEASALYLTEFAGKSNEEVLGIISDEVSFDNEGRKITRPDYSILKKVFNIKGNTNDGFTYDTVNPIINDFLTSIGLYAFPIHHQRIEFKEVDEEIIIDRVSNFEETGQSINIVKDIYSSNFTEIQIIELNKLIEDNKNNKESSALFTQDSRTSQIIPTPRFVKIIDNLGKEIDNLATKIKDSKIETEKESYRKLRTKAVKQFIGYFGVDFTFLEDSRNSDQLTFIYDGYNNIGIKQRLFGYNSTGKTGFKQDGYKGFINDSGQGAANNSRESLTNPWRLFSGESNFNRLLEKEAIYRKYIPSSVVKVEGKAISMYSLSNTVLKMESALNELSNLEIASLQKRLSLADLKNLSNLDLDTSSNPKLNLLKDTISNINDTRLQNTILYQYLNSNDRFTSGKLKIRNLQSQTSVQNNKTQRKNTSDLTNFKWLLQQYFLWKNDGLMEFIRTETSSTSWSWRIEKEDGTHVNWVNNVDEFSDRMYELFKGAVINMKELKSHPMFAEYASTFNVGLGDPSLGGYDFFSVFGFLENDTLDYLNNLDINKEWNEEELLNLWNNSNMSGNSISRQVIKEKNRVIEDAKNQFNQFGANLKVKNGENIEPLDISMFALNWKIHQIYSVQMFYGGYNWFEKFFKRSKLPVSTGTSPSTNPEFYSKIDRGLHLAINKEDSENSFDSMQANVLIVNDIELSYIADKQKDMLKNAENSFNSSVANTNINKNLKNNLWDNIKTSLGVYKKGINVTDGQSWTSLDLIRLMMKSFNLWNSELEKAYQREISFLKALKYVKAFFGENYYESNVYKALRDGSVVTRELLINNDLEQIKSSTDYVSDQDIININSDPKVTFTSHKWQYQGPIKTNNEFINRLNPITSLKTSFPPLLPSATIGTAFEDVMFTMYEKNIDVIATEGAVKGKNKAVGKGALPTKVLDLYTTNSDTQEFSLNKDMVNDPNLRDYTFGILIPLLKEQLKSSFKTKEKSLIASQFRKLLFTGTKISYFKTVNGKKVFEKNDWINESLKNAYDEFNDQLEELSKIEREQLEIDLGIDFKTNTILDKTILIEGIISELMSRPDDPDASLIRLLEHLKNEKSEVSFFDFTQATQILGDFVSGIINKRIARVKLPGNALILKTSIGTETDLSKLNEIDKKKVLDKYGERGRLNEPLAGGLKFYEYIDSNTQVRSAEALLSISQGDFSKLLYRKDVKDLAKEKGVNNLTALNILMENTEWYESNIDLFTVFGYRIPTSGLNLMDIYRIKKFLPAKEGNIIVVPPEATLKAGEDFDIDKKNFYFPSFNDSGNILEDISAKEYNTKLIINKESKILKKLGGTNTQLGKSFIKMATEFKKESDQNLSNFVDNLVKEFDSPLNIMLMGFKLKDLAETIQQDLKDYLIELNKFSKYRKYKKKLITNQLIQSSKKAALDPSRYYQLILPVSTDYLAQEASPYKMYSDPKLKGLAKSRNLHTITDLSATTKKRYDMVLYGQKLTGLAATGTTMFEMLSKSGLRFNKAWSDGKESGFNGIEMPFLSDEELSVIDMGNNYTGSMLYTFDNILKSDLYNQFTQATIDAASASILAAINTTNDTFPVMLYLMELGVPLKRIFAFITQPVIHERQVMLEQNIKSNDVNKKLVSQLEAVLKQTNLTEKTATGNTIIYWNNVKAYLSKKGLFDYNKINIESNSSNNSGKLFNEFINEKNADMQLLFLYLHNSYLEQTKEYLENKRLVNHDTAPDRNPISAYYRVKLREQLRLNDQLGNSLIPIDVTDNIIGSTDDQGNYIKSNRSEISYYYQPKLIMSIGQALTPLRANKLLLQQAVKLQNSLSTFSGAPKDKIEKYQRLFVNDWIDWLLKTQFRMPKGFEIEGKSYEGKVFAKYYEDSATFIGLHLKRRIEKYNLVELRDYLYQKKINYKILGQQIGIRAFVKDEKLQDIIREDLDTLKSKDLNFYNRFIFTILGQNGFNKRFDSFADIFEQTDIYEIVKDQMNNIILNLQKDNEYAQKLINNYSADWVYRYSEKTPEGNFRHPDINNETKQLYIDFSNNEGSKVDEAKFLLSDIAYLEVAGSSMTEFIKKVTFNKVDRGTLDLGIIEGKNPNLHTDKIKAAISTALIVYPNSKEYKKENNITRMSSTFKYKAVAEFQNIPVNPTSVDEGTVAMVSVEGGEKTAASPDNIWNTVTSMYKVLKGGGQIVLGNFESRSSKWNKYGEGEVMAQLTAYVDAVNKVNKTNLQLANITPTDMKSMLDIFILEDKNKIFNTKDKVAKITSIDIYNLLGNKTKTDNIIIKQIYQKNGVKFAENNSAVFSMRVDNTNKHFGNPFSSVKSQIDKGLVGTDSTETSVRLYIDWILGRNSWIGDMDQEQNVSEINQDQVKWIRKQLNSGVLKGKKIVYYKELGEPSHATALDYLINNWETLNSTNEKNNLLSANIHLKTEAAIKESLSGKKLEVNPIDSSIYMDELEPGVFYPRASSLTMKKFDIDSKKEKDALTRAANRGTIADESLRKFILQYNNTGKLPLFNEFKNIFDSSFKEVNNSISNTDEKAIKWSEKAKLNLYKTYVNLIEYYPNYYFMSDIPTMWGDILGKTYAGTIDLLAINRNTGEVMIIDLKTSSQDRRDPKGEYYESYSLGDKLQQSVYLEMYRQRMNGQYMPTKLLILDIKINMELDRSAGDGNYIVSEVNSGKNIEFYNKFKANRKTLKSSIPLTIDLFPKSLYDSILIDVVNKIKEVNNDLTKFPDIGIKNIQVSGTTYLYKHSLSLLGAPITNYIFSQDNGRYNPTIVDLMRIKAHVDSLSNSTAELSSLIKKDLFSNIESADILSGKYNYLQINSSDVSTYTGSHKLSSNSNFNTIMYEQVLIDENIDNRVLLNKVKDKKEDTIILKIESFLSANSFEKTFPNLTTKLEDISNQEKTLFKQRFFEDDREVGYIDFTVDAKKIDISFVSSYFKRQGYAKAVYNLLSEQYGLPISKSNKMTKEDKAFRNSNTFEQFLSTLNKTDC